jgi:cytoskeletal protein RodZ
MSQPPGQYGQPGPGQYGQPGGYGPPGGPGFGGPGGYGQPPQKKSVLPWVITAAVVVLAGVGILLFFLLKDDDDNSSTAASSTTSAAATTSSSAGSSMGSVPTDTDLPTGASRPTANPTGSMGNDAPSGGTGETQFAGSDQVALDWVNAVFQGDTATAYSGLCADYQQQIADLATQNGVSNEDALAAIFYGDTLGNHTIQDGTFDSIAYDSDSGLDVASFSLTLDDGSSFQLLVGVDENLTVCGFA